MRGIEPVHCLARGPPYAEISIMPQSPASEAKASSLPVALQSMAVMAPLPGRRSQGFLAIGQAYAEDHAVDEANGEHIFHRVEGDVGDHDVGTAAELFRCLAHRAVLAGKWPDDGRRRAGRRKPFALSRPGNGFDLGGITRHAHVAGFHAALGGFHLPAMQGVFLHGGDEELAVRREGDAGMRALPFQIDRIAGASHPMQCHAVVTCNRNAQALGRKGNRLHRALFLEFLDRAVR